MKTHSSTLGLCEISEAEAKTIEGGMTWAVFWVAVVVSQVIANPQAHINAFLQGYNEGYEALKTSQQ